MDKYSDKLVGHLVTLRARNHVILLDRTNNISERHFGQTKIGWRRKVGTKKLTRILKAARHEEFLVTNIEQQDYINIVYGGAIDNMPAYFAEHCNQAFGIHKSQSLFDEKQTMPISKKSLRKPSVLTGIVQAIGMLLGCKQQLAYE